MAFSLNSMLTLISLQQKERTHTHTQKVEQVYINALILMCYGFYGNKIKGKVNQRDTKRCGVEGIKSAERIVLMFILVELESEGLIVFRERS